MDGLAILDVARGDDPFVREGRRHTDVQDDGVRTMVGDK